MSFSSRHDEDHDGRRSRSRDRDDRDAGDDSDERDAFEDDRRRYLNDPNERYRPHRDSRGRFQKGYSGNVRGRPRKTRDIVGGGFLGDIQRALEEQIAVIRHGKKISLSMREIAALKLVKDLTGDDALTRQRCYRILHQLGFTKTLEGVDTWREEYDNLPHKNWESMKADYQETLALFKSLTVEEPDASRDYD